MNININRYLNSVFSNSPDYAHLFQNLSGSSAFTAFDFLQSFQFRNESYEWKEII